jgi:hypothetical protein
VTVTYDCRRDRYPGSAPGGTGPLRLRIGQRPARSASPFPKRRRRRKVLSTRREPSSTRRGQSGTVGSGSGLREELNRATASNLDTQSRSRVRSKSVHAVEFSKTVAPPREGRSLRSAPRRTSRFWGRQPSIAPGSGVVARITSLGRAGAGRALSGRSR